MTTRVRNLTIDDYADLLVLYRELMGEIAVVDGDAGQKRLAEILAHPGTSLWGAEVEGRVVSVAVLHMLPNLTYSGRSYCLIENVVTLAAFQRRGLGRQVMNAAIEAAWSANAYKIMLLTGSDAGANGFYEKLGFRGDQKVGMVLRRTPTRKPTLTGSKPTA